MSDSPAVPAVVVQDGPALVAAVLDRLADLPTGHPAGTAHVVTRAARVAVQPLADAYLAERQTARIIRADRYALASELSEVRARLDALAVAVEHLANVAAECVEIADGEAVEAYAVLSGAVSAIVETVRTASTTAEAGR